MQQVVLGDAVCTFNPAYGQGVTTAALQASALQKQLQVRWLGPVRIQGVDEALYGAFVQHKARHWDAVGWNG